MEKREHHQPVSGVNECSHGEQSGGSLKKVKIEQLCDLAILLLGIYPEETLIQRDTCSPMFMVALFTMAKTWK